MSARHPEGGAVGGVVNRGRGDNSDDDTHNQRYEREGDKADLARKTKKKSNRKEKKRGHEKSNQRSPDNPTDVPPEGSPPKATVQSPAQQSGSGQFGTEDQESMDKTLRTTVWYIDLKKELLQSGPPPPPDAGDRSIVTRLGGQSQIQEPGQSQEPGCQSQSQEPSGQSQSQEPSGQSQSQEPSHPQECGDHMPTASTKDAQSLLQQTLDLVAEDLDQRAQRTLDHINRPSLPEDQSAEARPEIPEQGGSADSNGTRPHSVKAPFDPEEATRGKQRSSLSTPHVQPPTLYVQPPQPASDQAVQVPAPAEDAEGSSEYFHYFPKYRLPEQPSNTERDDISIGALGDVDSDCKTTASSDDTLTLQCAEPTLMAESREVGSLPSAEAGQSNDYQGRDQVSDATSISNVAVAGNSVQYWSGTPQYSTTEADSGAQMSNASAVSNVAEVDSQDNPQDNPQDSPQDDPQDNAQDNPQVIPQDNPQDIPQDNSGGTPGGADA